jgi:hypothetical protein
MGEGVGEVDWGTHRDLGSLIVRCGLRSERPHKISCQVVWFGLTLWKGVTTEIKSERTHEATVKLYAKTKIGLSVIYPWSVAERLAQSRTEGAQLGLTLWPGGGRP